jgi:hypothetical protein
MTIIAPASGMSSPAHRTLARLEAAPPDLGADEVRCARLLRERLGAALAVHDAGEDLRAVRSMMSSLHRTGLALPAG